MANRAINLCSLALTLLGFLNARGNDVISSAQSSGFSVDTVTVANSEYTVSGADLPFRLDYSSSLWWNEADDTSANITVDGEPIFSGTGEGTYWWSPNIVGRYTLAFVSANGTTMSKTFKVIAPTVKIEREEFNVCKLTASDGVSEIRYTTDGSVPTVESALYIEPFEVPSNRFSMVRASTFAVGCPQGEVADGTFKPVVSSVSVSSANCTIDNSGEIKMVGYDAVQLPYDVEWEGDSDCSVQLLVDGKLLAEHPGDGEEAWIPEHEGLTTLILKTLDDAHKTLAEYSAQYDVVPRTVVITDGNTPLSDQYPDLCQWITNIVIDASEDSIGDRMLAGCCSLTSVTIPAGVTSIGDEAFLGCTGLGEVVIGSGVESIGVNAFAGCSSITNVTIASEQFVCRTSVAGFYEAEFTNLGALDGDVSIVDNARRVTQSAEVLYADDTNEYTMYAYGAYMYFEGGVTYYFSAEYDDYSSVKVNDAMVISPASGECEKQTGSIFFAEAGWHWLELRGYNYGGQGALNYGCEEGLWWWTSADNTRRKFEDPGDGSLFKVWTSSSGSIAKLIPDSYEQIRQVTFDGELTSIPEGFFAGCSAIENIDIPSSVTKVGVNAFAGCSSLTSVTIPDSVWDIGDGAFAGCTSLHRVEAAIGLKRRLEKEGIFANCPDDLEIVYRRTAEIRNVVASQRNPWNGKVDITFEVEGNVAAGFSPNALPVIRVSAEDRVAGTNYVAVADALIGDVGTEAGTHHVIWDLDVQGLEFESDAVVFTVTYGAPVNKYCVIDLSAGADAASYPVSYIADEPTGGWTDEYKTTKLVLRLIEPGSFKMSGQYNMTLTKPYYMGVFEVTQKQYELVMGSNPSYYRGDKRPVERVTWNAIRGNSSTYDWPNSTATDPSSFMGRIQARTGLNFDLPTEAQWEYACRADTTSKYNNGGDSYNDLELLGRHYRNTNDGVGDYSEHVNTGSYLPNEYGLYDMHGNVWEWCLDWYGDLPSEAIDFVGPISGSVRVTRGGSWKSTGGDVYGDSYYCTSSARLNLGASYNNSDVGFRMARTMSGAEGLAASGVEVEDVLCSAESTAVSIDSLIEPVAESSILVAWDAAWIGGDENATVVIEDNGVVVTNVTGAGEFEYALTGPCKHTLTYKTLINDVEQDDTYTATVFKGWVYEVDDDGYAFLVDTAYKSGDVEIPSEIDGHAVVGIADGGPECELQVGDWISVDSAGTGMSNAYRSNGIDDDGRTEMALAIEGPLDWSFKWKVSSEGGYDYLHWSIDGNEQKAISGTGSNWEDVICQIPEGEHSVSWTYTKDGSASNGDDCGWVAFDIPQGSPTMFSGCDDITSVTIPDTIKSIGKEMFAGCAGLQRVDAPKALRAMIESRNVFKDCADDLEIEYLGPEISEVVAKQRFPWNGLVDISFTVTGMENSSRDYGLVVMAMIPDAGKIREASHCYLVRDGVLLDSLAVNANGNYRLLWDAEADLGKVYYENLIVRVDIAGYVVDDSSGDSAPFVLDTVTGSAPGLRDAVSISYDAAWIGGNSGATVVIEDNGVEIARKTGAGEFEYQLTGEGRHNLTYKTLINGVEQEEQYAATILDSIEFGDMYAYWSATWTDEVDWKEVGLQKRAMCDLYTGAWQAGLVSVDEYVVFEVMGAKSKDEIRPVVENLGFKGSATATVLSDDELRQMVMPPLSTSGEWDIESHSIDSRGVGDVSGAYVYGGSLQNYEYEDDSAEYEWPKDLWPDNTAVGGRFWVAVKLEPPESMRWHGIDGSVRVWQSGTNVKSDKFYIAYSTDDAWPCYNDASGLFRGVSIDTKFSCLGIEVWDSDLVAYDAPLHNFWLESAPADGSPLSITLPEAGVLYLCVGWTGALYDIQVRNADSVSPVTRFYDSDKYRTLDDESYFFECGRGDRYSPCYRAITVNSARTITLEREDEDDDYDFTRLQFFPSSSKAVAVEVSYYTILGRGPYNRHSGHNNEYLQGYVTGTGVYKVGELVALTAVPAPGEAFDHWELKYGNFPEGIDTTKATLNFTVTDELAGTAEERKQMVVRAVWKEKREIVATPNDIVMGAVSGSGMYLDGTNVKLTATPNKGYMFAGWSDGVTTASRTIEVDGEDQELCAYFEVSQECPVEDVLDGDWSYGANGEASVEGRIDATAEGGVSVRLSAEDDASAWVETVVTNGCRVSFDWKCSCEELVKGSPYDYMYFAVDGEQQDFICGETDWTNETFLVAGDGEHTLRWVFVRDDEGSSGQDCAWLANVAVDPAVEVAFEAGGATEGSAPSMEQVYSGDCIILPDQGTLIWPKHTFAGWSNGAAAYDPGEEYVATGDTVFTALWVEKTLSAPVIDAPEEYEADFATVTITAEEDVTIHYTLDGSVPTSESLAYQGPFDVEGSATIRAIAVRDDYYDSEVVSFAVTRLPWTFGEYLNWSEQVFTTGGDAEWVRAKGVSEDGYALKSGDIGNSQTSRLETVVTGPGTIRFSCRVEGEIVKKVVWDGLAFCIDGVQQGDLMGNAAWEVKSYEVAGAGSHTLSWLYVKDEEGDGQGEDCAWLDKVVWTPKNDDVAYVTVPDEKAEVVASGGRYVVTAKGDEVLTEGDFTFGVVAKEAYKIEIAPDGKSATVTLAAPEIAVATEQEADDDDPSGMLANVDEGAISAKPAPEAGETLGALPVKTYPGLYYQVSWGDDLGDMTAGEKVQATGEKLYLGVIKQTGDKGFYKISVSEE